MPTEAISVAILELFVVRILQTWLPSSRMDVEDKTDKYFDTALIRGR